MFVHMRGRPVVVIIAGGNCSFWPLNGCIHGQLLEENHKREMHAVQRKGEEEQSRRPLHDCITLMGKVLPG